VTASWRLSSTTITSPAFERNPLTQSWSSEVAALPGLITDIPRPITMGVFGITLTTREPLPSFSSIDLILMPAAKETINGELLKDSEIDPKVAIKS